MAALAAKRLEMGPGGARLYPGPVEHQRIKCRKAEASEEEDESQQEARGSAEGAWHRAKE
jgi:hypothetical protein